MHTFFPRTLLWRLVLVLIVSQLAILFALGWIALSGVRGFQYDQVHQELQRIEPVLVDVYRAATQDDSCDLDALVKQDGVDTGLRITLILMDGTVIADSEVDPSAMENHRYGRSEIESALTTGEGSATRYSNTLKQDMIYFCRRSTWPVTGDVLVRVSLPVTGVESELSHLRRLILIAGGLSSFLTFLVVYFVSRRFSGQVEALAETASLFADGDLDYHVPRPQARELSHLADSLNRMGHQLSERITELQSQQAEQRTILESMSNGVIALDLEHHVLNMNRAAERLLGVSLEGAHGRLLQEIIRHPQLSDLVTRLVSGGTTFSTDIEVESGSAARRVLEVKGEVLTSPDDSKGGVLLLLNDITERTRFESMRSDFAANVSHELRTPITNIKGYAETLQDVGWEDVQQADRFLGIIRTNSDRLAAIVEDVMSLTNLERTHLRDPLEFQTLSVSDLLESVAEQFSDSARVKRIEIVIDSEEVVSLFAHPRLLQQAVANLVSNAVRYSPVESRITLCSRVEPDQIKIMVIDEGPGIPEVHLARLFERFYRVDKARSRELGGTGLGLAIVKHIASVHGGQVSVSSVVGAGSVFSLILPAIEKN